MRQPRKVIRKSSDDQYYFGVIAGNGEPVGISEMYTSKQGAEVGFYDHAKAVIMIVAQEGKLKHMLDEMGIDVALTAPAAINDEFVGQRPPERPPRKPSPLDNLG